MYGDLVCSNNLPAIFFAAKLYDVGQFNALTPERLTLGCLWPERLSLPSETLSQASFQAPQCLLSPHHTRWINAYQLARAAVPSPVTNVIPDPTKPNLPSQPGQDGGCPQFLDSGEIMGKASGNLGYMSLLNPAKHAGDIPWRIDICLFRLLARLIEVWAGFQGWKPMVAALFPRPIDHRSIRTVDALPLCKASSLNDSQVQIRLRPSSAG